MRPNIWVLIVLIIAALLMFGGFKKLPDAARSIGRSLRIFKAETQGLVGDDTAADADAATKTTVEPGAEVPEAKAVTNGDQAEASEEKPSGTA